MSTPRLDSAAELRAKRNPRIELPPRSVLVWLLSVYLMIFAMVLIGGITRLTGSGLSMVEWRPLMGALPPTSDAEWNATFDKYKRTPQYKKVNAWMKLADFKRIFFWEYLHRLFGRLIGVVFLLPWLYLLLRRRLRGKLVWKSMIAFALGGAQGLLGWIMVKSGLVDEPAVSHYRLAAHLGLALVCAMWVLWLILDVRAMRRSGAAQAAGLDLGRPPTPGQLQRESGARRFAWGLVALMALQIFYGALMAGKRAGLLYATFPDMNGEYIPEGAFAMSSVWQNLLDNPVGIHTMHRMLAYLAAIAAVVFFLVARKRARTRGQRSAATLVLVTTLVQVGLGVLTVLTHVDIVAATVHQGVGFLLLSALLVSAHSLRAARDGEPSASSAWR